MAQNRIHLADTLLKELVYIFEEYLYDGQKYGDYSLTNNEDLRIRPIAAIDINLKNTIVVTYDTADGGSYIDDTIYGGASKVRTMTMDITVTAKKYYAVLAAGDFLESYFDGKAIELGAVSNTDADKTFKLMEVSFIGESGVELDDSENHSETFNFNIIYSKGN